MSSSVESSKKFMKKIYLILCLSFLVSSACFAGGGTAWGKIKLTYVNHGWTMVDVDGISDNPDGCESTTYYAMRPSDANYEVLHSTLMAAQLANKRVRFWVSGCSGQGSRFPKIVSVWVHTE